MIVTGSFFLEKGNPVLPWSDWDEDSHEGQAGWGPGTSQDESIGQLGLGEPGCRKGVGIGFYDKLFEDF